MSITSSRQDILRAESRHIASVDNLAANAEHLKEHYQMSNAALARAWHLSPATVKRMIDNTLTNTGRKRNPTLRTVTMAAVCSGMKLEEFLGSRISATTKKRARK